LEKHVFAKSRLLIKNWRAIRRLGTRQMQKAAKHFGYSNIDWNSV